jgi:hypothetical protein
MRICEGTLLWIPNVTPYPLAAMIGDVRLDRELNWTESREIRESSEQSFGFYSNVQTSVPPRADLLCVFILQSPDSNSWAKPSCISPSCILYVRCYRPDPLNEVD